MFLSPIGILIFFLAGDPRGFVFSAFGLLPLLYLFVRVLSPGAVYSISENSIFLRNGRTKGVIPFDDLRGAAVLSESKAHEILTLYMAPSIEGGAEQGSETVVQLK